MPFFVCILEGPGLDWLLLSGTRHSKPPSISLRHVEPLSSDGSRLSPEGGPAEVSTRGIFALLYPGHFISPRGFYPGVLFDWSKPFPKSVLRLILLKEWDKILPLIAYPFTHSPTPYIYFWSLAADRV